MECYAQRARQNSRWRRTSVEAYDPDHKIFPIPLKYVDVMRQTQTSVNNVSENIINDLRTEAKGVNLSEERTGTARFQILRTRLLEGYR